MSVATILATMATMVPMPSHYQINMAECPAHPGQQSSCAYRDGRVYIGHEDVHQGADWLYEAVAHELGHQWWFEHMNDADQLAYAKAVHNDGPMYVPPEDTGVLTSYTAVSEQFADTYALCAMKPRLRHWNTIKAGYFGTYGETIKRRYVAQTCWLIKAKSRGDGWSTG